MTLSSHHRSSESSFRHSPHASAFPSIGPFESTFAAVPASRSVSGAPYSVSLAPMATVLTQQRPALRRNSPLSVFRNSQGFAANPPMLQNIAVEDQDDSDDSSGDDAPQPVKFSALTNALLASQTPNAQPDTLPPSSISARNHVPQAKVDDSTHRPARSRSGTPSNLRLVKASSPAGNTSSRMVQSPRVVRVSSKSFNQPDSPAHTPGTSSNYNYITPAPVARSRVVSSESYLGSSGTSASNPESNHGPHDIDQSLDGTTDDRDDGPGPTTYFDPTSAVTTFGSRARTTADQQMPSSQLRIRRARIGAGSLLSGAPIRRGFKPRDSTHQDTQIDLGVEPARSHALDEPSSRHDSPISEHLAKEADLGAIDHGHSPESPEEPEFPSVRPLSPGEGEQPPSNDPPAHDSTYSDTARQELIDKYKFFRSRSLTQRSHVLAKTSMPPLKTTTQTVNEDESEVMPPPAFKRNNIQPLQALSRPENPIVPEYVKTPIRTSQQATPRRVLAPLSENTPRRQAPQPPPKMSILDAATKSSGAPAAKPKKKRQHVVFKGQTYTQLRRIGHGGSAQVYCVMAENGSMYALKKVKLESINDATLAGFLGEVKLLMKFNDSDRVVRLIGHELDNNKQQLSLLMELGDHDFARFLHASQTKRDGKLDTVMVRYYWKEMLECVQAAHDLDVVHSDLKPANFLSKEGRLKLIDFGIANAIDVEHTVNVHRDGMVGTTNYMSPESLTNANEAQPDASPSQRTKTQDMKLGKPSDVWSLGCVLYQMTYGTPPFAHISNPIQRCMAIPNPKVAISYPEHGLGGTRVPTSLSDTLKACLRRNPADRPTVDDLLAPDDAFLYPDVAAAASTAAAQHNPPDRPADAHALLPDGSVGMSEELLARILENVVERARKGNMQSLAEVRQFSAVCLQRIRDLAAPASGSATA